MEFKIVHRIKPASPMELEVSEISSSPEYYIDGKKVPPTLAKIIELGLGILIEDYLDNAEARGKLAVDLMEGR